MSEIHCVVIHLGPNRVAPGYYVIDDGILTMTWDDGTPVILDDGNRVQHTLKAEENPRSIAAVLTGEIRRSLLNEIVPGFGQGLDYPEMGVA